MSNQKIYIHFDFVDDKVYCQRFSQQTVERIEIIQVVVSVESSKPKSISNNLIINKKNFIGWQLYRRFVKNLS